MPLWTKPNAQVSCQTLMLTACFSWLCWDCLTMSCCSSRGVFSRLQTGLCPLLLAAWNTFDELVHIVLCEDISTAVTADSELIFLNFFFRSRPRRSSMLETSSRAETSLSPHYASILSLRFKLGFGLFMLVHGGRLWALKSWGSYINLGAKKTSLFSLCLSHSLFAALTQWP